MTTQISVESPEKFDEGRSLRAINFLNPQHRTAELYLNDKLILCESLAECIYLARSLQATGLDAVVFPVEEYRIW